MPGRLLGIDFGARRIGVAVSEGRIAVPLTIIEHTTRSADIERIAGIARDERADGIVLGLPLLPSGDEGEQSRRTRAFGAALAARIALPLHYYDELLTTTDATPAGGARRGRAKVRVDDVAAALILQRWLDAATAATSTSTRVWSDALGGYAEITSEREAHIAIRHPDLLPEHRDALIETLIAPDDLLPAIAGRNQLLIRWTDRIKGGRSVVAVVATDPATPPRHWLVTAYSSRRAAEQ